ncbi:MAG: RlmE family RNA methyltransferase [Phyllobacteriaceae bacterium]|jgi:23S rRNA (uridine2552-2'-O)-methyltransferase|nr:RlmE family RNA methyltransferase [Phyllobacteriaceae bacterium]
MSRPGARDKMGGGRLKVRVKTGKGRTVSQKNWLERQLNDPYVHEAKKLGYRSRAAFKLSEIDDKYKFLKVGGRVVDLGAAPGGWSQVSAQRVKSVDGKGKVVAIDMHSMDEISGVTFFKKDFYDEDAPDVLIAALGGEKADVVLSDMASHATGHRQTDHINIIALVEAGYDFARQVLKPGGTYLAKVLRGGTESQLLTLMKKDFATVRHVKPMASRDDSAELFVLATGFRG